MRSANPALNEKTFRAHPAVLGAETMTLNGTVNKTGIMLILLLAPAAWTWNQFFNNPETPQAVLPWMLGGMILGLILGLVTAFKAAWAPALAPVYAICQGFFLGGLSAIFEARFPGIVIQAVALTFGTLAALLMAYKTGIIKATENFKLGVAAATGGIFLIYLTSFALSFFSIRVPYIHESGLIGIGFSLFVVVIAALNLVLDFDFIETGAERGAPKYMEWYGAFGLMVTLIWLYIEFLRLLAKLNSRR